MSVHPATLMSLLLQTPGLNGRRGLPAIFWGPPGIAKTAYVRAVARQLQRHCETVIASVREPADFVGLPVKTENGVIMSPPAYAKRAAESRNAIIFYDEGAQAPPAVQAAMLRVVNEGVIGDEELPPEVSFILAANHPNSPSGGWELKSAMANRLIHLTVGPPDHGDWATWLMSGDASMAAVPILDMVKFDEQYRRARALVVGYTHARPTVFHNEPKDEASAGLAWPSPRSWHFGALGYAAGMAAGNEEAAELFISGSVGTGVAGEFLSWVREQDLPSPGDWLDRPSLAKFDKHRLDRTFAILSSIAAEAVTGPLPKGTNREQRVEAAWTVLMTAIKQTQKDVVMLALRQLHAYRVAQSGEHRIQGAREQEVYLAMRDVIAVIGPKAA